MHGVSSGLKKKKKLNMKGDDDSFQYFRPILANKVSIVLRC